MTTDSTSSLPSGLMEPNGDADDGGVLKLQGSPDRPDGDRYTRVTIPIRKEILHSLSFISSALYKLVPMEGHHVIPIFALLFVETVFLRCVGCSNKEVLSAIFFTSLFGRFGWPVWCNLKLVHHRLDDVFGRIEAIQQSIKSLESVTTNVVRPPMDIPVPAVPLVPREEPTLKVDPEEEPFYQNSEKAVAPPVATVEPPYTPYKISTPEPTPLTVDNPSPVVPPAAPWPQPEEGVNIEGFGDNIAKSPDVHTPAIPPVAIKNPSPPAPPAAPSPDPGNGVFMEGMDNIIGRVPEVSTEYATPPAVNPPPSVPSAPSTLDHDEDVQHEGMENIIAESESDHSTASGSTERPTPETQAQHGFSRWLPVLHEIKLQFEQAAEGKIQRISHQGQPSMLLSLRRLAVRLLMTAASLSPANFAPHTGYLGPSESTPYYPTGDREGDRSVAFTIAVDCMNDLETYLQGDDAILIATRLFELAQALNDLGLCDYALNTSGFALEALERPYNAVSNNTRLRVASILSLRSNILCDLKKTNEATDAADRAVTLCKEHKDSQTAPVPELAYALLNHAVILNSIGLREGSAAVAFELLSELDESQPDMKDISVLCKLCLSNARIGADNDMALSMAEETIESTANSTDANSQTVLAGALLAKSKSLAPTEQNDTASVVSASAVTLLRSMSAARPVFSLFLAHALDNHAHNLSEANRTGESYSVRQDAVEHWQTLRVTAGGAVARPLAWSLFELSKFRRRGDRNALREELQLAEDAVELFREVEPLDAPGLGDALYLYADRMLELDKNQEAVTYAEESVHYFQEAADKDPKYALDLIFSLSLASACLACTERADYAFEDAKRAVEVQRGRIGVGDKQYKAHLCKLLMDVVFRATEMEMQDEVAPWLQELENLTGESGVPLARRSGNSQGDEFRKQTSYWMDSNTHVPRSNGGSSLSTPGASSSALRVDKGKGKEVAPLPASRSSTPYVDKGKGKEVDLPFDSSAFGHRVEEIMTPGAAAAAAAQRRLSGVGSTQGNAFGGSSGARTLGGSGSSGWGTSGLGHGINSLNGARGGYSSRSSSISRPGTGSGTGI